MVREDDVGGQKRADREGIRFDPVVELGPGAVLDAPHLVPLVAVEDEDGQQAADVRAQRSRRRRGRSARGAAPARGR